MQYLSHVKTNLFYGFHVIRSNGNIGSGESCIHRCVLILAVGKEKIDMKVVLDTNFLVSLVKFKVGLEEIHNLIGPSELCTIEAVVKELKAIAESRSADSRNAKVALELIKRDIRVLKSSKNADDALLALDKDIIIATNDAELRKKLKGRRTIYLRARKRLALE